MQTPFSDVVAASWAKDRLDVFSIAENNLTHKFWDGSQWNPAGPELEILGNGLATPPVVVTWGADRLDVFGLDDHNVVKHQYWDGSGWRPNAAEFENLGGSCSPSSLLSVTTWGPERLDIFCRAENNELLHQYYDGSQWQPSAGSFESLGHRLGSSPTVVSWGKNRLDIFALDRDFRVVHLYWDGSRWSEWELLKTGPGLHGESLVATSWGENRLDLFGVDDFDGSLWHLYWDGSQWSDWEALGDGSNPLEGRVGVTSWSPNRLDIVGLSEVSKPYLYKFYDGQSWQPDTLGWYNKAPGKNFASNPSVVSWGENRLDIFGLSFDYELFHQAWTGYGWFPSSTDWEYLGGGSESESTLMGQTPVDTKLPY